MVCALQVVRATVGLCQAGTFCLVTYSNGFENQNISCLPRCIALFSSGPLVPVAHSRDTAQPLPSIAHSSERYVVAEQGVEFELKVEIVNPSLGQTYRVLASIDGQDVGYTQIVHYRHSGRSCETTFRGWFHDEGDDQLHYRTFRLGQCKPSANAAIVQHPDQIKAGKIVIECNEVVATSNKHPQSSTSVQIGNGAQNKKLPEGKKWFLQPGLKAEAGEVRDVVGDWDMTVRSLSSLTIKYDTAENLKLRNILKPSNPQHAAILRNSGCTRVAALLAADNRGNSTGRQQQQSSNRRRGVKRERSQQRHHDDDSEYSDSNEDEGLDLPVSATGPVVDLCEEDQPGPLKVNGRALKTDELAVCDLCDSDSERNLGKWRIKKKQAITIR